MLHVYVSIDFSLLHAIISIITIIIILIATIIAAY